MFKSGSLYVKLLWCIWDTLIQYKLFETAMSFRIKFIGKRYNIEE